MATAETLLGLDDLRGYGPLPAQQVPELAYSLNATWSGVLVDDGGYPKKLAEKRYRFTGKLAEFIRLRENYCTFPGCSKPAEKCDLDHRISQLTTEPRATNLSRRRSDAAARAQRWRRSRSPACGPSSKPSAR